VAKACGLGDGLVGGVVGQGAQLSRLGVGQLWAGAVVCLLRLHLINEYFCISKVTGNSHTDTCSIGGIQMFCRVKSFRYCFDIFGISFGLARLGISKIQNSLKEDTHSVMQNCSNLENGSLFFFNFKIKDYVNTLFTLAYRIILCGKGDKITNSCRKPQRKSFFPIVSGFVIL